MNKKKKLILILSIITLSLLLIIGGTIAFFGWKAEEESSINVTVAGGNGSCTIKEDNNVFIEPTLTKNGGRIITLKAKQDLASKAVISWNMVINEIEGLSDKSFKYEMINALTGASYGSGNFENITEGSTITFSNTNEVLALGIEYEFTLYLWIDGNAGNNPLSMADQILDFDIQCNLTSTDTGTYIGTNMLMIVDSSLGKADTEVFLRRNEEGEGLLRNQIESVTFVENIEVPEGNTSIDVSYNEDDSVIMWYGNANSLGRYDVYIGGANGKTIIRDGAQLFARLTNVKTINFNNAVDTSNMTSMNKMFNRCTNLIWIGFDGVVTSNVTSLRTLFQECSSLTTLNLNDWDTSNVTDMAYLFNYCTNLTTLNISNWDTSQVTTMRCMFQTCTSLIAVDLSNFDVSNVTDMYHMFLAGTTGSNNKIMSLTSIGNVSNWDTANVTDMTAMFQNCSNITTLDVRRWDTGNVTSMGAMFANCYSLTSLDLSDWNTSNVTNMDYMFRGCSGLTTIDVSNFNTSKVTSMCAMFDACSNLTEIIGLNANGWNTENVTDMGGMFASSPKLTSLDLSNFNTSKVTNMYAMFYNSSALEKIYVSNLWNTSAVTNSANMFTNCSSLVGGSGTTYNANKIDAEYARVDKGTSSPGYFTYKKASI